MKSTDLALIFLSLGILLAGARIFGELARKVRQPAIVGEILAGVVLGPTLLGRLFPELQSALFPTSGAIAVFFSGFQSLAASMFLFVAGLEMRPSLVWTMRKSAFGVSVGGWVFPFALGVGGGLAFPELFGREPGQAAWPFALTFATALSISALPVIVRALMDLGLYRTPVGAVTLASAIVDDLAGWIVFSILVGFGAQGAAQQTGAHGYFSGGMAVLVTVVIVVTMLTAGRVGVTRVLARFPAGSAQVTTMVLCLALFSSALTEWVGVHALLGAFLAGMMVGESEAFREADRKALEMFTLTFFAPVFIASLAIRVDFLAAFAWPIVLSVLLVAFAGKIFGCALAARWGGMSRIDSWTVGFCMNARGAMGIVLAHLALQSGLIGERLFVALAVTAIVTSMAVGPVVTALRKSA